MTWGVRGAAGGGIVSLCRREGRRVKQQVRRTSRRAGGANPCHLDAISERVLTSTFRAAPEQSNIPGDHNGRVARGNSEPPDPSASMFEQRRVLSSTIIRLWVFGEAWI